jgi:two-component system, NarL family, nitrate/nitrite response regulator NarL
METQEPRATRALRIAVIAPDPVRRAGLVAIVTGAGHEIVNTVDRADVVLADADGVEAGDAAVVSLGSADLGQAGILSRDASPVQIVAALRGAAAGLIVRSAVLPRPVFGAAYPSEDAPLLTPREIEVLAAIGDGLSNKEVARRLGISPHTVKFHVEALFDKLDVTSRAEAVHKGLKRGLIDL